MAPSPATISVGEVHRLLEEGKDCVPGGAERAGRSRAEELVVIDVREPFQRAAGRIAQAHWIPGPRSSRR